MNKKLNIINNIIKSEYKNSKEFLDTALEYMISLTDSKFGYLYYYDKNKKEFILHAWSNSVMPACSVQEQKTKYSLDKTGCWGDVVRENKPIIINDYETSLRKKGIPVGHVPLKKFMSVPIYSDGEIVAVAGVANKVKNYTQKNIDDLTEFTTLVWHINEFREVKRNLENELISKDLLFKEAEHRILNNLTMTVSILGITCEFVSDAESLTILKETSKRIETIASIHRSLYHTADQLDYSKINIKKYLTDVFTTNTFLNTITYNLDIVDIDMKTKIAMIIGLILNELVTNSIKYAWPTLNKDCILNVILKNDNNKLMLSFNDNGVGNKNTKKGIGSIILDLFSQQLEAEVKQYSENGYHYNITFNL